MPYHKHIYRIWDKIGNNSYKIKSYINASNIQDACSIIHEHVKREHYLYTLN